MRRRGDHGPQDDPAESAAPLPDPGDPGAGRRLWNGGVVGPRLLAIEWAAQGPGPAGLGAVSLARPGDEWTNPSAPAPGAARAATRARAVPRIATHRHA